MDDNGGSRRAEGPGAGSANPADGAGDARAPAVRSGLTWRALILSILAAVVLSVAATLLLGGSFRLTGASNGAPAGSGAHGPCCPLPGGGEKEPARASGQR